ncbi:MAG: adenylate/guanylate cyclase domain-containing protein [Polyangiaceae bacterium]
MTDVSRARTSQSATELSPRSSVVTLAGESATKSVVRRGGLSILEKTLLVFVTIALLPALGVSLWLTRLYVGAVETTERQIQTAVLSEISSLSLRRIEDVRADAEAIASALGYAASEDAPLSQTQALLRSILGTRRTIRAARFEVPGASISTVLRRSDERATGVPESTPELRSVADERGVSFSVLDAETAMLVVPVPRTRPEAKPAYVTVKLDPNPLAEALRTVAETRFDDKNVELLIADGQRRTIASFGSKPLNMGSDASSLPIWRVLPQGTTWSRRVSVVSEHTERGVPQVGAIETVPDLGWAVAVWRPRAAAYASLSALTPRFAVAALTSLLLAVVAGVLAARAISGPVVRLAQQARLIGLRQWSALGALPSRRDEIGDLSNAMGQMASDLVSSEAQIQKETRLRADLSRFMTQELVTAIVRGEHPLELGGKRANITVLFADVVAFTPFAENRPAEEVVGLLNELFGILSEIVFRHRGVVDKFIGDCIMAVWGVPVAEPEHGNLALAAAEEMLRFLESGNEEWVTRYGVEIRLAIGVNSGSVVVGNIGSKKRMEYTVIGDVVNVAARLEAVARPNQNPTRRTDATACRRSLLVSSLR